MNTVHAGLPHERDATREVMPWLEVGNLRPSFRWSDLWKAPLHDFPIRDEILYQYLPLAAESDILEVGPGSGFTAFRMARHVRRLTLMDAAPGPLAKLQEQLGHLPGLILVCADVTRAGLAERLGQRFDAVYALDVFEYLADPATALRNFADVLRPQGELFLTYPNVPPPEGDGVTCFARLAELEELLERAGFRRWQVFAVRLRPYAAAIYRVFHEWPLQLYRQLRRPNREARPQTYDATWAFQHQSRLHRYKLLLHLWWLLVEGVMRLRGDLFTAEPVRDEILGRQLVVRAWR